MAFKKHKNNGSKAEKPRFSAVIFMKKLDAPPNEWYNKDIKNRKEVRVWEI